MATYHTVGGQQYTLNSSISSTATSITLSSFTEPVTGTPLTMMNMNTDIAYGTIAPKTSQSEFISFTGVTQNSDGTATLTGVTRGLAKKYPYTTSASYKLPHAGQSVFILSDAPQVFEKYMNLDNDQTATGVTTYTQFPVKSGTTTPTSASQFATKAYVDATATGSATTDQEIIAATAGETLAAGNLVYLKAADGRWWLTDADTASTVQGVQIGFAQGSATAGNAVNILTGGIDKNQTSLTPGTVYYASNTAGAISSSTGTTSKIIGQAITSSKILLNPDFSYIPASGEKDALAGAGPSPSSANKFTTEGYFTGMVVPYAGGSAPTGWLLCDGSAVSRTTYSTLFALISTTYGTGDGSTTFNVPDMRGRVPIGVGTGTGGASSGTGLPTGGSALTAVSRGTWKGEETHTLSISEMPSHNHNLLANGGAGSSNSVRDVISSISPSSFSDVISNTGGGAAHNNIQPVMGLNFIIKT